MSMNRKAKRKVVLVDLDSTIVDLLGPWLATYNETCGDNLLVEELTTFETHEHARHGNRVYEPFAIPGFFADLPSLPGAIEAVKRLHEKAEVVIVTSAPTHPQVMGDKAVWVKKHLPFLCGLHNFVVTGAKYLIHGDVLIDDAPRYAEAYKERHPKAFVTGILFPYNQQHERHFDLLAPDWKNTEKAWDLILSEVMPRLK